MSERLRTVRLYGELGSKFGRVHRLAVSSAQEAVRALSMMLPGFDAHMMSSRDRGIHYSVFLGKENIGLEQLEYPVGNADIRIAPMITGSKRAGFFQAVLGIALIAASVFFAPAGLGLKAVLMGKAGLASTVAMAGASMALGGIAQMLTPIPKGIGTGDSEGNRANQYFNGPVNTQAQGNAVPILYGRLIVGSAVISAGIILNEDVYVPRQVTSGGSSGGSSGGYGGGSAPWHFEWVNSRFEESEEDEL